MFEPKTIGCQSSARKSRQCGTAAKPRYSSAARIVALGIAVAMLSLPAMGSPRRGSTPPTTPGNFHVTAKTNSSVSFAWNASTNGTGGSLGYNIINDTTGFSLNVGNITSYTWTIGVEAGGTYSFHIEAYSGSELVSPPARRSR